MSVETDINMYANISETLLFFLVAGWTLESNLL